MAPTASPPPQRTTPLREVQYETRSFQLDVTVCPECGGTMKIVAALTDRLHPRLPRRRRPPLPSATGRRRPTQPPARTRLRRLNYRRRRRRRPHCARRQPTPPPAPPPTPTQPLFTPVPQRPRPTSALRLPPTRLLPGTRLHPIPQPPALPTPNRLDADHQKGRLYFLSAYFLSALSAAPIRCLGVFALPVASPGRDRVRD